MFTKGEWRASKPESSNGWWNIQCGAYEIATAYFAENDEQVGENANLIAAAPDMYEALRGIINRRMECHETEAAYIPPEIEAVYKALAKAEGKDV